MTDLTAAPSPRDPSLTSQLLNELGALIVERLVEKGDCIDWVFTNDDIKETVWDAIEQVAPAKMLVQAAREEGREGDIVKVGQLAVDLDQSLAKEETANGA